jgi:D-alanyl-D-alanine carboxypeptidase (penicillin-binding protein 5/6)
MHTPLFQNAYITSLFLAILYFLQSYPALAAPTMPLIPEVPKLNARSYILMEASSGQILAQYNATERVEPASLTKMMTMYIVDQERAQGRLHLDELIPISPRAWKMEGSRMFVNVNTRVKAQDLIHGLIVQSGNDATQALAEYVGGDETGFVTRMNKTAHELGMNDTHFTNAAGLPDPEHYTTAKDMAILSRAIIRDFPDSYVWYSQKFFDYNGIKQFNRNRLLWNTQLTVDGIKTGHTDSAGYCLAASAKQDNMRLISVLMGAASEDMREQESLRLLNYGFRFYEGHQLYAGNTPLAQKRVFLGSQPLLPVGLQSDLTVIIPRGAYTQLSVRAAAQKTLKAPIAKNTEIGSVAVYLGDNKLIERTLIALNDIPKGSLWQSFKDQIHLAYESFFKKKTTEDNNLNDNLSLSSLPR